MATNHRGHGTRIRFTASATRASNDFVYEDGFHGVCVNDVVNTEVGVLDISQSEIEVDLVSGAAVGDRIYLTPANALTKTVSTNRLVGIVTANPTTAPDDVPTGKMWMLVLPQNITVPT